MQPTEPRGERNRAEVGFGQGGEQAGGQAEFVAESLLSSQRIYKDREVVFLLRVNERLQRSAGLGAGGGVGLGSGQEGRRGFEAEGLGELSGCQEIPRAVIPAGVA